MGERPFVELAGPGISRHLLGTIYPQHQFARVVETEIRVRVAADVAPPRFWPPVLIGMAIGIGAPLASFLLLGVDLATSPAGRLLLAVGCTGLAIIFGGGAAANRLFHRLVHRANEGADRFVYDRAADVVELPAQGLEIPAAEVDRLEFAVGLLRDDFGHPSRTRRGEWHLYRRAGGETSRHVILREAAGNSFTDLPHAAEAERLAALLPFPAYFVGDASAFHVTWRKKPIYGGGVVVTPLNEVARQATDAT